MKYGYNVFEGVGIRIYALSKDLRSFVLLNDRTTQIFYFVRVCRKTSKILKSSGIAIVRKFG